MPPETRDIATCVMMTILDRWVPSFSRLGISSFSMNFHIYSHYNLHGFNLDQSALYDIWDSSNVDLSQEHWLAPIIVLILSKI